MKSLACTKTGAAILVASLFFKPMTLAQQPEHKAGHEALTIRLAIDLVSVNVMVTDRHGRSVTGLNREDFKVYEDGVEQPISFFSAERAPVSWGLVLDRSRSMRGMIEHVYQAALHVVDEGTEQDEILIAAFNHDAQTVCDFTTDRQKLDSSIFGLSAGGRTALYDAVAFALNQVQRGKHRKKVLVVVTDGEDNSSRLKFRKLVEQVKEGNVLIYTIGMFEAKSSWQRGMRGGNARVALEKLAEVTGGRAYFPTDLERCREAMKEIARDVSHQYSVGYYPSNPARDGQWRKIKIVVIPQPRKGATYAVRTRSGYYAPDVERYQ